jgi:integrase
LTVSSPTRFRILSKILLGHASVKITERHYAPWVKARQEQLEAEVRKMWTDAPKGRGEN